MGSDDRHAGRKVLAFAGGCALSDELLTKIAGRMDKVGCPVCLNTSFSVILRCDFSSHDTCVIVGVCGHCGTKFDIENVATLEETRAQAERKFSPQPCACGSSSELRFLCDLKTEDCFFVAVCPTCGSRWPFVLDGRKQKSG